VRTVHASARTLEALAGQIATTLAGVDPDDVLSVSHHAVALASREALLSPIRDKHYNEVLYTAVIVLRIPSRALLAERRATAERWEAAAAEQVEQDRLAEQQTRSDAETAGRLRRAEQVAAEAEAEADRQAAREAERARHAAAQQTRRAALRPTWRPPSPPHEDTDSLP
jgi:hypothetical protein